MFEESIFAKKSIYTRHFPSYLVKIFGFDKKL